MKLSELIEIKNDVPMASSLTIARHFGKEHRNVIRMIENIIQALEDDGEPTHLSFIRSTYKDATGRTLKCYYLTRDAATLLMMGFTGHQAVKFKSQYIKAFNAMEAELLKHHSPAEWSQVRAQGIQVRRSFTDCVQSFVDYATAQGSSSAKMYYANLTKMEYKALGLLERFQQTKGDGNFRDLLNSLDLCYLSAAEYVVQGALNLGMSKNMPYKEIYAMAKEHVENYAKPLLTTKDFVHFIATKT